ncbi:hypothetical protein F5J12DRAFT_781706 [Pisolithus orientalis]|uniref:uncharacterized protein n=1 Tax=Pisolithus orientalis TaxID=936130 RepID=UPI002225003D|nr:uncharacterized protein F5J12DRAFT_781706 [Pisolithus orientalis]KAI6010700.1 hypothetical protein F5J12DRAFT_781706 [Pisolithus orientalis]
MYGIGNPWNTAFATFNQALSSRCHQICRNSDVAKLKATTLTKGPPGARRHHNKGRAHEVTISMHISLSMQRAQGKSHRKTRDMVVWRSHEAYQSTADDIGTMHQSLPQHKRCKAVKLLPDLTHRFEAHAVKGKSHTPAQYRNGGMRSGTDKTYLKASCTIRSVTALKKSLLHTPMPMRIIKYAPRQETKPEVLDTDTTKVSTFLENLHSDFFWIHYTPLPRFSSCARPTSMWCSRCQGAWYCTQEHLQIDWPRHHNECIPAINAQTYHVIATLPPAEQQMVPEPRISARQLLERHSSARISSFPTIGRAPMTVGMPFTKDSTLDHHSDPISTPFALDDTITEIHTADGQFVCVICAVQSERT